MTMTEAMGTGWKVTGQTQTTQIDDATSKFTEGLLVNFATDAGHTGSVFLPMAQATAANVRAAIAARVAILDSIAGLSADGG